MLFDTENDDASTMPRKKQTGPFHRLKSHDKNYCHHGEHTTNSKHGGQGRQQSQIPRQEVAPLTPESKQSIRETSRRETIPMEQR